MRFYEFWKQKEWKRWDKSQWVILVLAGVLLMVVAIPADGTKRKAQQKQPDGSVQTQAGEEAVSKDYAKELEEKLEEVLSRVSGAGRVKVMVTLEDSGERVVEKDTVHETSDLQETDEAGTGRTERGTQTARESVYREGDEGKTPFVGKEMAPRIAGVLVVAEGGADTAVKQNISEAVMALFQIDVNRIKVVKMNIQEEED